MITFVKASALAATALTAAAVVATLRMPARGDGTTGPLNVAPAASQAATAAGSRPPGPVQRGGSVTWSGHPGIAHKEHVITFDPVSGRWWSCEPPIHSACPLS